MDLYHSNYSKAIHRYDHTYSSLVGHLSIASIALSSLVHVYTLYIRILLICLRQLQKQALFAKWSNEKYNTKAAIMPCKHKTIQPFFDIDVGFGGSLESN